MWPVLYFVGAGVFGLLGTRFVVRSGPPPMTLVLPGAFLGLVGVSNASHGVGNNLESLMCALYGAMVLGMVWQASITDWSDEDTTESDKD